MIDVVNLARCISSSNLYGIWRTDDFTYEYKSIELTSGKICVRENSLRIEMKTPLTIVPDIDRAKELVGQLNAAAGNIRAELKERIRKQEIAAVEAFEKQVWSNG